MSATQENIKKTSSLKIKSKYLFMKKKAWAVCRHIKKSKKNGLQTKKKVGEKSAMTTGATSGYVY